MNFNFEDELEKSVKSSKNKDEPEEAHGKDLAEDHKKKLSEAMSILFNLSDESKMSLEDLIKRGQSGHPFEQDSESPHQEDNEESMNPESSSKEDDGSKVALYVARMKAKKGQ